jgi:hypothetical protein
MSPAPLHGADRALTLPIARQLMVRGRRDRKRPLRAMGRHWIAP